MSKTTKLLLLDSLLQEVCIESGLDGSLTLSLLGLSVCLVSHNLLYSGLKKAFSMTVLGSMRDIKLIYWKNLLCLSCLIGQTFQYRESWPLFIVLRYKCIVPMNKFLIRVLKLLELGAKNIWIITDLNKYVLKGVYKDLYLAVFKF